MLVLLPNFYLNPLVSKQNTNQNKTEKPDTYDDTGLHEQVTKPIQPDHLLLNATSYTLSSGYIIFSSYLLADLLRVRK